MTTQNARFLSFALSSCTLVSALYVLERVVVGNQTPGFHHIYEPGGDYQSKLKLFARSEVPDSALSEVYNYLIPGLKFSGDSR